MEFLKVCKCLADENRLEIIRLISEKKYCVRALSKQLGITESRVSQHIRLLKDAGLIEAAERNGYNIHYAVKKDALYGLSAEIKNMADELCKKYNASVYVDEAHSLGVFGNGGRGICDHFGLTDDVDIIMGTFSKSLASIGGFVAADKNIINYLRHNSRPYIFSASITPSATASALAALEIMQQEPERIEHLWEVTQFALKGFR
jgi:7-keto-8-aminopelargonate synthetase-like enzyme